MTALRPGVAISPSLTLVAPIGRGGMGQVWRARHSGLGTAVAVKFLARSIEELNDAALLRFQREARATARIDSRHVVRVHDAAATSDGTPFLVMELLEGESVAQRVARLGRLAVEEVAVIVAHASDALGAAHAQGILHRDISSGNLFLTRTSDGRPCLKVLDFGIAKVVGDDVAMTQTGLALGTPRYMSPEQTLGRSLDARTDLWSLAVVAYEALVGRAPFEGTTPGAVALEIDRGRYPMPSHVVEGLSPAIDAFMQRALAPDVDARFDSASGFAEAFAHAVGENTLRAGADVQWGPLGVDPSFGDGADTAGTLLHRAPDVSQHASARLEPGSISGATLIGDRALITSATAVGGRRSRRASVAVALAVLVSVTWGWRGFGTGVASESAVAAPPDAASADGPVAAPFESAQADANPDRGDGSVSDSDGSAGTASSEQPNPMPPARDHRAMAVRKPEPPRTPVRPDPTPATSTSAREASSMPRAVEAAPSPSAAPARRPSTRVVIDGVKDYGF